MKYIYILNLKIKFDIFGDMYYEDDIYTNIFDSYQDARLNGIEKIKDAKKRWKNVNSIIDFEIIKVALTSNNVKYNLDDIKSIKRKDLYNYLMSIVGKEYITLDRTGYPGIITVKEGFADNLFCPKSFDYNKKYHLDKFKIGDYVKAKVPFESAVVEKIYEIFDIVNKDTTIYESNDPLHFRQGYALTDIYNEYCNKYTQLHFDEDLIKSSKEEYDNCYYSFEIYDNENNIIGKYGDRKDI